MQGFSCVAAEPTWPPSSIFLVRTQEEGQNEEQRRASGSKHMFSCSLEREILSWNLRRSKLARYNKDKFQTERFQTDRAQHTGLHVVCKTLGSSVATSGERISDSEILASVSSTAFPESTRGR